MNCTLKRTTLHHLKRVSRWCMHAPKLLVSAETISNMCSDVTKGTLHI